MVVTVVGRCELYGGGGDVLPPLSPPVAAPGSAEWTGKGILVMCFGVFGLNLGLFFGYRIGFWAPLVSARWSGRI